MEKLFKLLSDAQASLFVLFQKTWIYHWDVVGPDFQQLHTLFGGQYETMFEEIDTLTEHMRYLEMKPVSTLSRITEVSHIDQASNSAQDIDAKEMVKQLRDDNKKIVELFAEVSEEADKQKQFATSNLVQSVRLTFAVQSNGAYFNWEQFDVVAIQRSDASVGIVVSNRTRCNDAVGWTAVSAAMSSGQITISLTQPTGQTAGWVNYSAVEFNLMVD